MSDHQIMTVRMPRAQIEQLKRLSRILAFGNNAQVTTSDLVREAITEKLRSHLGLLGQRAVPVGS